MPRTVPAIVLVFGLLGQVPAVAADLSRQAQQETRIRREAVAAVMRWIYRTPGLRQEKRR